MSGQQQQQHLISLGERGFHLFVNEFMGEPKIYIRKIFEDPADGSSIFTKYGVALSIEEWNNLKESIQTADNQLMNMAQQAQAKRKASKPSQVKTKTTRAVPYNVQRAPATASGVNQQQQQRVSTAND